jgi:hypothetical protein
MFEEFAGVGAITAATANPACELAGAEAAADVDGERLLAGDAAAASRIVPAIPTNAMTTATIRKSTLVTPTIRLCIDHHCEKALQSGQLLLWFFMYFLRSLSFTMAPVLPKSCFCWLRHLEGFAGKCCKISLASDKMDYIRWQDIRANGHRPCESARLIN